MPVNVPTGGFGLKLAITDAFSANLRKYDTMIKRSKAASQAFTSGLKTSAMRLGIASVAAVGLGYALHKALQPGLAFEKQMREVSAVTGATTKEFKLMTNVAKKLGIETVFSAKAAAGAMYMLGSRGVKTAKDFETLLIPAMDLAAALKFDLVPATELMMATLKMFDMEMTDATQVADLLTNAYRNSAANADKLSISMNYAGFAFSAVGYTLRDTLVPLEALYDLGLEASMAGTALRKSISSLIKPTNEAKRALMAMGLSTADVSPELYSFIEIIETLEDAGMTTAQALEIFGQRAGPAMSKLVSMGADALRKYDEGLGDVGSASETAKEQLKGFQGAVTLLKSSLEGIFIAFEELLAPALEETTRGVTEQINAFLKWLITSDRMVKGIQDFIKAYGSMIRDLLKPSLRILKDLVTGVMTLIGTWSKMSAVQKEFVMRGIKVGTVIATLGIAVGILGPAVLGLAKAFSILGLSGGLLSLKFLLIIAGVSLLAVAAYALRDKWKTAWDAVVNATDKCWNKVKEFVNWVQRVGIVPAIVQILHAGWEWTKSVAQKFATWIWPYVEPLIESEPVQAIIRVIHKAWDWVKSTAKKFADWVWPYIEPLVKSKPVQIIIGVIHQAWDWIKSIAKKFADWVKPFIDRLIESKPIEVVAGIILKAWEWIKSTAQNFGEWIMEQIEKTKQTPQIEISVGVILKSWNWMGTQAKTLYSWFMEQYEKGAWGKLSMGIIAITAGITLVKWLLLGAIPSLGAFFISKLVAGGVLGAGGILGPIGLIGVVAILLWKVTPESVDKFWRFWYKELPDILAAKIKPAVVALLDVAIAVLSWEVDDSTWASFAWAWENKVKPALKALAPSLALVAPLIIAFGKVLFAPDVKEKLKTVAGLIVVELGKEIMAIVDFYTWFFKGMVAQQRKLESLGIELAGRILIGIGKGLKAIGVTIWDLMLAVWRGGLPVAIEKIKGMVEELIAPTSWAFEEAAKKADVSGLYYASLRYIENGAKGMEMGVQKYSPELVAQMKKMYGDVAEDTTEFQIAMAATSTMNYWEKFLAANKKYGRLAMRDASIAVMKDFVTFMGDGYANASAHVLNKNWIPNMKKTLDKLEKAMIKGGHKTIGGFLDSLADKLKAGIDLEPFEKKLLKRLGALEPKLSEKGQDLADAFKGESPGFLTGMAEAIPGLGNIFQNMLSIMGDFMGKIYDYLKTVPGLGKFLQQFEDLIKLWKRTEKESMELIDQLSKLDDALEEVGDTAVESASKWLAEIEFSTNVAQEIQNRYRQQELWYWVKFYNNVLGIHVETFEDMEEILKALPEGVRAVLGESLDVWKGYFNVLTDENMEYYKKVTGYMGDFREMTETELENVKDLWEKNVGKYKDIWDGFTSSVKSSMEGLVDDLITGIKGGKKAWKDLWTSFGDVIVDAFREAFAKSIVEKMGFDKMFEGNILNLGNLFTGLGNLVVGVFKGIGNIVGSIFGGVSATAAIPVTQSITAAGNAIAETGVAVEATTAKMGIMHKVGLGLEKVLLGFGNAFKYFGSMAGTATTAIGGIVAGLGSAIGVIGTAYAAWQGFSYLAENVIGPVFSGLREGLAEFFGMAGATTDSVEEMSHSMEQLGKAMAGLGAGVTAAANIENIESFKDQFLKVVRDVALGLVQIGDMTHAESVMWLAETTEANEHFTREFKDTVLGILAATAEGTEAIVQKSQEAIATTYDATWQLYEKTAKVLENMANASAKVIVDSVIATEDAIEHTTGKVKESYEKQLEALKRARQYGTDYYWHLYREAKKSFEETKKVYEELYTEAERLAEEATDAQIEAYAKLVAANERMTDIQKRNLLEVLGLTHDVIDDMLSGSGWLDMFDLIEGRARKTWGRSGTMPIALSEAINAMIGKIEEFPTRIDFDIIGNLSMPSIPRIGTQYFDIIGSYRAPSIPSYQMGIPYVPHTTLAEIHRKEAVLTAPQAEAWRKGEGGRGSIQIGEINVVAEFPNVDMETLTQEKAERIFRKRLIPAIKESVLTGVFSRDMVPTRRVR